MSSTVVLIPARYGSSRFPGKPLVMIKGRPMVEWVYKNCQTSGFECAVVTDNKDIEDVVRRFGGQVLRVDDDVPSGTERVALAFQRHFSDKKYELVINVQGDEPLLKGEVLRELAQFHLGSSFEVTTLLRQRHSTEEDFTNPNVVKAVWSPTSKQCLYFSRQSLPFARDSQQEHAWYHHIGVYSYRPSALEKFVRLPLGQWEDLEKLEQLRALENEMTIGAILTTQRLIGVDMPEDIKKVEGALV